MQTSQLPAGQPIQPAPQPGQPGSSSGPPPNPVYGSQQQQQQQQQPQQAMVAQQGGVNVGYTVPPTATHQNASVMQQQTTTSQFPHQGLNGGWQSDKDYQERRKMIAKIVHLLQQRKPNAPQEWLKKLPQMAKRLEESLYRSAKSFEEYNDASTLKQRLQQLAVNIGMKTKKMQQQQALLQQQKLQQQQQQQRPQPGQPLVQPQAARPPTGGVNPLQIGVQQPQQQQQQQQQQVPQPPTSQRMVSMSDINPMISNQARPQQPQPTTTSNAQQQQQFGQPQQQSSQSAALPSASSAAPSGGTTTNGAGGQQRQVSDRQQVLRHQQQRLLLLRHAAKCQHDDGRCPVTPHCAGMKRLWKHIAECKNQKCLVPHCVSSRYVLSHYHRCKDVRCPVCGPVREAIHRSHEKQKQMQALKQRHQQAVQQQQAQGPTQGPAVASAPGVVGAVSGGVPTPITISTSGGVPLQSASAEPAKKRQRTSQVLQPVSMQQQQQQLLQQRSGGVLSGAPGQVGVPAAPGMPMQPGGRPQLATVPGIAFSNGQVIMPKLTGPKPQEDHTLINCFSIEQIETHIASLSNGLQLPPQKLKTKCLDVLKVLQSHQHGWVFNSPVDPVELGLPDYFEVIKKPMDLGTIRKRLENGVYHTLEEFEGHVNLTFDNAMLYNPEGSVVYNMANEMKLKFKHDYAELLKELEAEEDVKRRNGEACLLCGCEKLLFEPPVFYCNGMNCPSKRIRRNSYYYVGGNNQYHWCHQCFQELGNQPLDLGDIQIKKEALVKKKNDEVHEESWVQCDRCERWVHQICALFNTRQNKDQRSEYACPKCTIKERREKGISEATSTTPMAEDLPRTLLSEHLENHVRKKVDAFIEKKAQEKAQAESLPIEDARKKLQMGGHITIRQVTSMDRKLEVRERMKKRYAFKNYPDEFNFRCKCIVVFQNLDGVDVMLFGLYVYEHNEKNPLPNKRAVYVSYLDSVHYMRPRQMRTFIYHEILIAYLDYVRRRGFSTAHIWACPPLKGDDYILYAKPEDQKVPKDDRLRQWYIDMLIEAQRRGVVGKVTNMYDLYFKDPKNDATIVPYLDGDYFPAEVENIIKDIEEGKGGKKGSSQGKKKKEKKVQKKKTGRGGTRSTGLDEEALKASGFVPPGTELKSIEEGGRDYVMTKLGETIQPMKESFIVAFLAWKGADEANMVVPKHIQEYRDKNGFTWKIEDEGDKDDSDKDKNSTKESNATKKDEESEDPKPSDKESENAKGGDPKPESKEVKEDGGESKPAAETEPSSEKDGPDTKEDVSESKTDSSKEDADGDAKPDAKPDDKTDKPEDKPEDKSDGKLDDKLEDEPDDKSDDKPNDKSEDKSDEKSDDKPGDQPEDGKDKKEENAKADGGPTPMEGVTTEKELNVEGSGAPQSQPASTDDPKLENPSSKDESADAPASTGEKDGDVKMEDASKDEEPKEDEPKKEELKVESGIESSPKPDEPKSNETEKASPNAAAVREGKFAAMQARKRDVTGSPKEEEKEEKKDETEKEKPEPKTVMVKDSKGNMVKVLDDDEEELDCEFLNNRQAFLNLCQGNHYQFDFLRRAKHSSMMVLWHLHNRDAPKFVQQCATCSREILAGYRFHCSVCADFDQCQECLQNPKIPRHPHQLKPVPIGSGQQQELTAAQRRERQRSIQLHMTLLLHAATCKSAQCPSANCTKMKGLLKHGAQCQVKASGGCNVCKRIWALLQLHARQCKAKTCPVPNCMAIRERFRQLKKQQQAMDDRRRQEMNRAYRGKR